jgi:hypothetical protein
VSSRGAALPARTVGAVLARPGLWPVAVTQLLRMAPAGWWRRWPPLPTPDPRWLAFRMETQYGDPAATAAAEDVVAFLRWCRNSGPPRRLPRLDRDREHG